MATRLSLRLRIFLFFCLMAVGSAVLLAGTLAFSWSRLEQGADVGPFVMVFILFAFLNSGLALGVWLLFDENVAKPINKLSADLRLRAHSGINEPLNTSYARYLGDLGSAANALSETMNSSVMDAAEQVAHETQRLRGEKDRLTDLLSQIPIASILLNPSREIVLYDSQAAEVLAKIAPPRLKAPIADYFDRVALDEAIEQLGGDNSEAPLSLRDAYGTHEFSGRIKDLGGDGHMIFIDVDSADLDPNTPRPLVFDFDLFEGELATDLRNTALTDLTYVAFDTETTGLSVKDDAIIQIGAVRVLKGRIVNGEAINTYVDPERPIPQSSTKIHAIGDADVQGAPKIAEAGRSLHHFCRDAVLVAHNAPFDIGLLRRSQKIMDVEWNQPVIDTVLLSAVVFGTTEDHTLDALCDRLSITIAPEARHTAYGDAQATAEVLVKLLPLLKGKGIETFGQLIKETQSHSRLLNDLND